MSKAYLNKYENGKSQTLHARDRANGNMHQSRVREYLDDMDAAPADASPVIITVPPTKGRDSEPGKPMAQMMLFDQPVTLQLAEPAVTVAVSAPAACPPAPALLHSNLRPPRQSLARSMSTRPNSAPNSADEFTLRGLVKGCGLGLATAAALLLAYLVVA